MFPEMCCCSLRVHVRVCVCVCESMRCPHLPDRVNAGGRGPAGCLQARAAPLPAPPPHTATTGSQTGPSPGSCSGAENHACNVKFCRRLWRQSVLMSVFLPCVCTFCVTLFASFSSTAHKELSREHDAEDLLHYALDVTILRVNETDKS